jgi:hypothetical protein
MARKANYPSHFEEIESNILKFADNSNKLEAFILYALSSREVSTKQVTREGRSEGARESVKKEYFKLYKEVRQMEEELRQKEYLISKYLTKLAEWEKTFKKLQEEQKEVLENIGVKEQDEEELVGVAP